MKRIISLLLTLALTLTLMPATALADESTAKVYNWKQTASQWSKNYSGLEWSNACALTAIAIQIARTDLVRVDTKASKLDAKTMAGFNPGSFARAWRSKGGLQKDATVSWGEVEKVIPGFVHKIKKPCNEDNGFSYYKAATKEEMAKSMKDYLDAGYYPIVEGPGSGYANNRGSRHFVAVIAVEGNDVIVIDPADGKQKSIYDVQCGGTKTRWTLGRLDYCGKEISDDYACCVLYKVDSKKLLKSTTPTPTARLTPTPTAQPVITPAPIVTPEPTPAATVEIVATLPPVQIPAPTPELPATTPPAFTMLPSGELIFETIPEELTQEEMMIIIESVIAGAETESESMDTKASEPMSAISISKEQSPSGSYKKGSSFYFKGIIKSQYPLQKVYGGIYAADGAEVQCKSYKGDGTKFNIYDTFDRYLRMGKLSKGSYVYKITAIDEKGYTLEVINTGFKIK